MKHHKIDIHMYKDYLRFAKLLGLDLKNNRYAFPKNLKESHDELEKQYEINNKKIINLAIVKRSNELLMRNAKKPDKSLVTVEVRHNKVVQSRIKNNKCPTDQQLQFLKSWEQNVLKGAA